MTKKPQVLRLYVDTNVLVTNNVKVFSNFTDIYKILPQPYLVNKYLK